MNTLAIFTMLRRAVLAALIAVVVLQGPWVAKQNSELRIERHKTDDRNLEIIGKER